MSLNWDLTAVKDHRAVCFKDHYEDNIKGDMKSGSYQLIELTMIVGINKITEANHDEFFTRLTMYENVRGLSLWTTDDDGKRHSVLTADLVKDHIGLRTNASPKTKVQFDKWLVKLIRHSAEQHRGRPH
tara:strand:+ start:445 stop:831 length:387 start_codon:yes stop_codon:yes gene_type:complete